MNFNLDSSIWTEKYRPREINDLILPENDRIKFEGYIADRIIPHLLFVGGSGVGKSTLSRILTSKRGILSLPSANLLSANGSAKKTRGIGYVDNVIEPFLKSDPSGNDKIKVVYIDECDYLTEECFKSLRSVIEEYINVGRFIWTANYIAKIPSEIQSRFQVFRFFQLPINYITEYCHKILDIENIEYDKNDLNFVIKEIYPDIRKIVNTLQRNVVNEKLIINQNSLLTLEKNLVENVIDIISASKKNEKAKVNKLINMIVDSLNEVDLDFRNIYSSLFYNKRVPVPSKIVINNYTNSHISCLVPSMHFMSMILDVIKTLK